MLNDSGSLDDISGWLGRTAAVAIGLYAALEAIRWLHRRRKALQASHWPVTDAAVTKGHIREIGGVEGGNVFQLSMPYSYRVDDQTYSGWYTEGFESLELAQLARTTLAERHLYVRYNPAVPEDSLINPYRDCGKQLRPTVSALTVL